MANYTPNFNLMKPLGSENYNVSQQNGNMDKIDSALQGLGNGLGIIANGNTHAAITSGEYVYVHGHGTLAEGLYKATANIAANGTLSSSNLSALPKGVGGDVSALNSKITKFAECNAIALTNGSATTYTLPSRSVFVVQITRSSAGDSSNDGLYIGHTATNASLSAIKTSGALSDISISGETLTITATTSNVRAVIMTFSWEV